MTRSSSDPSMRVNHGPDAEFDFETEPLAQIVNGSVTHDFDPAKVRSQPAPPLIGTPHEASSDYVRNITNLTSSASLDLAALLQVFNRNLNLLAQEWLSPTGADAILSLATATSYLRVLAHELRSASPEGDSRTKFRSVRLESWWPNMGALLHAVHGDDIAIRADIPTELPCVCIKPRHLTQVVFALVGRASSAIAANPARVDVPKPLAHASVRGEIKISARPAAHGRSIDLTIADNGVGMTPGAVAQAFEPGSSARLGRGGGRHSMARVRRLIHGIGGCVHLTSSLDSGTTVSLELPTPDGPETGINECVVG